MNRICWWLVRLLYRGLEPDEQIAVSGDLAECRDTGFQALRGVAGLVFRRQLALWTDWQPWLAVIGIVVIAGYLLSELVFDFDMTLSGRLRGMYNFRTDDQELAYLVSCGVALFLWSWVSGFTLGSLSRRATWLTALLFYLSVVNSHSVQQIVHGNVVIQLMPCLARNFLVALRPGFVFLFMLPGYWGASQGYQCQKLKVRQGSVLLLLTIIVTALKTWTSGFYGMNREAMSHGMYHAVSWPSRLWPLLIVSWPVIYIMVTAQRRWISGK